MICGRWGRYGLRDQTRIDVVNPKAHRNISEHVISGSGNLQNGELGENVSL